MASLLAGIAQLAPRNEMFFLNSVHLTQTLLGVTGFSLPLC